MTLVTALRPPCAAALLLLVTATPARPQAVDPDLLKAQSDTAREQLQTWLNGIAFERLEARASAVAALATRDQAAARQARVRRTILDLVGGLPEAGDDAPRAFATVRDDGFRIENVAYQSAPGYWVTANVYVPDGSGPFPAVVIAPGHGAGKEWQYAWGAAFARAGIVTLATDAMGQGERLQHFDPELGGSKVEPMGEHEHANQSALLIGQHVARYWFADGIRGVDYLSARGDVDTARIGTFGCSGGGTAAAYLAAMDPRIRVAAIASFVTSFRELLPGNGPQDAEQTLPRFVSEGLDFADWIELAAPRPVAIVAFQDDFFPIAGARQTFEEARSFYRLMGAPDEVRLIEGPGGHCNLGPVLPEVMGFLVRYLEGPGAAVPDLAPARPPDPEALTATPTGQVSTSLGGRTVEDLTREAAAARAAPPRVLRSPDELDALQRQVRADVRALAGVTARPGTAVRATAVPRATGGDGYRIEDVRLESEPGLTLGGTLAIPDEPGPHPAVLWMTTTPLAVAANRDDLAQVVRAGNVVLAFHPRGVLGEPPPDPGRLALGHYMPLLLRAIVVGRTLVGMRVDDTIRAVDWLLTRPEVDPARLTVYGAGAQGMVALHAAALDDRIARVVVEHSLLSYRTALEAGLHRNLSELVVPGVLGRYDTPRLIQAIAPRPVILVSPLDAMQHPLRQSAVREALGAVFETEARIGTPDRIRLRRRIRGAPVPLE